VLIDLVINARARHDDDRGGHQRNASKERAQSTSCTIAVGAPKRHHAGVKPKRHFDRFALAGLRRRFQQSIKIDIFHNFSLAEILSSWSFIYLRARKARTLINDALHPVSWRISSTERC